MKIITGAVCFLAMTVATTAFAADLTSRQVNAVRNWAQQPEEKRKPIESLKLPSNLSKEDADRVTLQIIRTFSKVKAFQNQALGALPPPLVRSANGVRPNIELRNLPLGEHNMPFVVLRKEENQPPQTGRPLFICMHGGGQLPSAEHAHAWEVNSREMQAQIRLSMTVYPSEGIYWIPRMADDRLGRWWHRHNHEALDQVIDHAILQWGVDPNRVYLLGISEGGYGTSILAPFMPDRFAAASAMAAGVGLGNPAPNLRNLAFRTDVGENDNAYNRSKLAVEFHQRLDQLHEADPDGYTHVLNVHKGQGHGINYRPGPEWITQYTRQPFPSKIVWVDQPLHSQRRQRFYWIEWDNTNHKGRSRIIGTADKETNKIELTVEKISDDINSGDPTQISNLDAAATPITGTELTLLLSDELLDLDRPIEVVVNGQNPQRFTPERDATVILKSLLERPDPTMAASARVTVKVD